jgi:hypothetical protein
MVLAAARMPGLAFAQKASGLQAAEKQIKIKDATCLFQNCVA